MIKIKKHIKTQYKGIKSHLRDLIELSQQTKFQINNSIKDFQFQNFHSKAISGKVNKIAISFIIIELGGT